MPQALKRCPKCNKLSNLVILVVTRMGGVEDQSVWPDWASFSKSLAYNFLTKIGPNILVIFWPILKAWMLSKNCKETFLITLIQKIGLIFNPISGHTAPARREPSATGWNWVESCNSIYITTTTTTTMIIVSICNLWRGGLLHN